ILNVFWTNVKYFLITAEFSVCIRSAPSAVNLPHRLKSAAVSAIRQCLAVLICLESSSFTVPEKDNVLFSHLLLYFKTYYFFSRASLPISLCSSRIPYSFVSRSLSYRTLASVTERCLPPVHPTAITRLVFPSFA